MQVVTACFQLSQRTVASRGGAKRHEDREALSCGGRVDGLFSVSGTPDMRVSLFFRAPDFLGGRDEYTASEPQRAY